ncbi:MAG: type II secretion system protein GspG [Planctomycetes bacterium]|nr:type II secretion system protein GspG [Planctomycetota bacterium]
MRLTIGIALALGWTFNAFGQDKAPVEQDIDRAIDQLYSERASESDMGRHELSEIGRRAIPRLLQELNGKAGRSPNARIRRQICEVLGRIRDNSPVVVDALIDRLNDTEEFGLTVAAAAAGALAQIADDRAVPALLRALDSKQAETDKWLKYYCIHALGILRAREGTEALIKALDDKSAAEVGHRERIHLISAAAADSLGRLRAKEAADKLGALLSSAEQNPYTQQTVGVHAARALERILGESKGPLEGDAATVNASLEQWRAWWNSKEAERKTAEAKARIAEIAAAVEKYKADQGEYPAVLAHLTAKPEGKPLKSWPEGGYYQGELKDPWGTPIHYDPRGENGAPFDVVSYGKGGRPWGGGDEEDLWNHENYRSVKIDKTRRNMKTIVEALERFKSDFGKVPDQLQDLATRPSSVDEKKWPEKGYLESVPKDGFDAPFNYTVGKTPEAPYDLKSLGADGKEGGTDIHQDIWNHEAWKAPRAEKTRPQLDEIGAAIEKFRKDHDRLPEKLEDLKTKPAYVKKWGTPYTTQDLKDAFANPLVYEPSADGKEFKLMSLGGDGKEGGEGPDADIVYQKK